MAARNYDNHSSDKYYLPRLVIFRNFRYLRHFLLLSSYFVNCTSLPDTDSNFFLCLAFLLFTLRISFSSNYLSFLPITFTSFSPFLLSFLFPLSVPHSASTPYLIFLLTVFYSFISFQLFSLSYSPSPLPSFLSLAASHRAHLFR